MNACPSRNLPRVPGSRPPRSFVLWGAPQLLCSPALAVKGPSTRPPEFFHSFFQTELTAIGTTSLSYSQYWETWNESKSYTTQHFRESLLSDIFAFLVTLLRGEPELTRLGAARPALAGRPRTRRDRGGRSGRPIDPQDRLTTIGHGVRGAASEAVLEPPGGTENKYVFWSLALSLSPDDVGDNRESNPRPLADLLFSHPLRPSPLLGADLQVGHLTRQRCRLSVSHREGVRTTAVR